MLAGAEDPQAEQGGLEKSEQVHLPSVQRRTTT